MENDEKCLSLNAGGSQPGPAGDSTRCGSQLSHNLKLAKREKDRERGRDVPSVSPRAKKQQK